MSSRAIVLLTLAVFVLTAPAAVAKAPAPGAPGTKHTWAPADKHGFGTARGLRSTVWFTLRKAELSEVYYPDLGTPSFRDLQFVVSDGATFTERETDDAVQRTELADPRSLTYRQVDTARSGRWPGRCRCCSPCSPGGSCATRTGTPRPFWRG